MLSNEQKIVFDLELGILRTFEAKNAGDAVQSVEWD